MKKLFWVWMVVAGVEQAGAFSLIGPFEAWQTVDIGYNLPVPPSPYPAGEVGAPKNLGEEFRWNMPVVVYGYDPSFLDYFGQKGVEAIEAAFKILNDLPPVSGMSPDLHEFPLDTRRYNYRAAALQIRDLKSYALSALLESIGLAVPERYVYTLRSRVVIGPIPFYTVIKRNFDPVTLEPSSYINGTLYTYSIEQTYETPPVWEAVAIVVDPYEPVPSSVAAYEGVMAGTTDPRGSGVLFNPGLFYSGLTRDDVGGIRYLLRKNNFNVETLPTNAIPAFSNGLTNVAGLSGGSVPWAVVSLGTGTATGATGVGGAVGGVPGVGAGVGGGTGTNTLVNTALRPGVDKLKFARASFDSLLGQFFQTNVIYADTFATNGALRQQLVQRTVTTPDILFSAADLGVNNIGAPFLFNRTMTFQNNETLNSAPGGLALGGPGTINSPIELTFSKIGPFFRNFGDGNEMLATKGLVWGSYDSSTNAPVVFPSGVSIQDLEQIIFTQSGGVSPWRVP